MDACGKEDFTADTKDSEYAGKVHRTATIKSMELHDAIKTAEAIMKILDKDD